ncbi:asparagine synthase (glutamine-hydrolysing) [Cohnella sp. OV330]|uniref:asparagine synthase-related protein n=1 Tax=Cohnella sp. OV330 TaxID=1855288 RepID=UPI0008E8AB4D|nr:asparagine synthase-related protein [Cohnella sp. OV330]SFB29781.1 asparagine synthase (glutamine-hydrolysing) [Cohnella sp. OV330]
MSAIAGIYQLLGEPLGVESGRRIMEELQRYPADDVHTWQSERVFLGCHAQWITPESVDEELPFYDRERALAITADAIIDNRAELFEKLGVPREDRLSMPDSLLIVLAYDRWGQDAPRHLVGDFAFILWDERNGILFGARDFSGSRTLYYHRSAQALSFCTTIGPLLALPGTDKQPNEQWIADYLAIPITVDSIDCASTVYKSIEQLPPAHSFSVIDGRISLSQFCEIRPNAGAIRFKSDEEYEEAFREVFTTAVNDCSRTRLQLGSQLSGGLDSSSVVSFAVRSLKRESKRLHTFSYYPVDDFEDFTASRNRMADERPFIRTIVDHVGNIEPHYLNFPDKSPLSEVDDWLELLEMPYKYYENTYWLKGIFEEARKHGVGVVLNGQRGNWSISWGHTIDYQARLIRQFRWMQFAKEFVLFCRNHGARKSSLLGQVSLMTFPGIARMISPKKTSPSLIDPQFAKRSGVFERMEPYGPSLWGSQLQNAYDVRDDLYKRLFYWNINGASETRLSLKYGVWGRDPTNDLRVLRFCLSLPDDQFVRDGVDRRLIRRATEGYLPNKVRFNRRLRGVQGADGVHRMTPEWNGFITEVQQLIKEPHAKQYLNTAQLKASLDKLRGAPRADHVFDEDFRLLMRALIFNRFMKRTFEGR